MQWWEALILGIVQGLSEFLPISSSGHLLLLEKLGLGQESLIFNIAVHIGTLLAVLIALRKSWLPLIKHPIQKTTGYILLASIPTVGIALILKYCAQPLLEGKLLGFGFVLTACMLFASEKLNGTKLRALNAKNCLLTGIAQGIAVLPGVSRSGATISALTLCGVEKTTAADFSFLLSIPIIIGSAILEGADILRGCAALDVEIGALILGAAAAFLSGLLAIKIFLKLIKKRSMIGFAIYTLLIGAATTLLPLFKI